MAVLLDTCVLVDLLRRNERAERAVLASGERPCVCAVSAMELHAGARSQKEERRMTRCSPRFIRCRSTISWGLLPLENLNVCTLKGFPRLSSVNSGRTLQRLPLISPMTLCLN
jgi:hypothetical protein